LGLAVSYFIIFVIQNSFTIVEVAATPLITDKKQEFTTHLQYDHYMAYVLFIVSGVFSLLGFIYFTKNFKNSNELNKSFDKNYLLISLSMSIVGSIIIVDFAPKFIDIL
jgi:hypothetical protein